MGVNGVPGGTQYYLSAYGIAVKHGFSGTEEEWLEYLKARLELDYSEETGFRWRNKGETEWQKMDALDQTFEDLAEATEKITQALEDFESAKAAAEEAERKAAEALDDLDELKQQVATAGEAALSAAGSADQAKESALQAAGAAASGAADARSAAGDAEQKAALAESAAQSADAAAAGAASAAGDATAAAEEARAAAGRIDESIQAAGAAAEAAIAAGERADQAAQDASAAAEKGDYAREQGDYAKEKGDEAAAIIEVIKEMEAGEIADKVANLWRSQPLTVASTIPAEGWTELDPEDPLFDEADCRVTVTVALEEADTDLSPRVTIDKAYQKIAKEALFLPTVESGDGTVTYWAKQAPASDIPVSIRLEPVLATIPEDPDDPEPDPGEIIFATDEEVEELLDDVFGDDTQSEG